jgi:hypothetical protein
MWDEVKQTVSDYSESLERYTQFKDWQTLSKVRQQTRISPQRTLNFIKVELSFWFVIRNSSETMAKSRYDLESFVFDWIFQRARACLSNLIFQTHGVPLKCSILVREGSCRKPNQRIFILWIVITSFRICPLQSLYPLFKKGIQILYLNIGQYLLNRCQ